MTNNLLGRVEAHGEGTGSAFTKRYGVKRLAYFEPFADIEVAIQREKTLKQWVRRWKINLIERENPHWADLYAALRALPGNASDAPSREMGPRDKREDDSGGDA